MRSLDNLARSPPAAVSAPEARWQALPEIVRGAAAAITAWRPDLQWRRSFEQAVDSAEVLSLDVFDTAITRAVESPCDVFALVEARLITRVGECARGFAAAREGSERDARTLAAASGAEEVSLAGIYDRLRARLPPLAPHLTAAMAEELDVEEALVLGVPDILDACAMARTKGKRILFVSDMYLPATVITRLLGAAGFHGWDGLFVSSEVGRTKATGRVWRDIEKRHGPLTRILHVGDDPWADNERPRELGLRTLPYVRARSERRVGAALTTDVLPFSLSSRAGALSRRRMPGAADTREFFSDLGAGYGALVVGSFVRWLASRAQRLGIRHLYFCARDGWLIQQAWNAIGLAKTTGISSSYLFLSRRPLNLSRGFAASATGIPSDELLAFLTGSWRALPLQTLLKRAGLLNSAAIVADAVDTFGSLDTEVGWEAGISRLRHVLERHPEDVIRACQPVYEATLGYLEQEGLTLDRPAALVDLGWHGTLQASVRQLLQHAGHAPRISGFYYGLWPEARGRRPATGWMESLFSSDFIRLEDQPAVNYAVDFLEELHSAPHGTVVGHTRSADMWSPVLSENPTERQQYEDVTRHFQNGVIETLCALYRDGHCGPLRLDDLTPSTALAATEQLALSPTQREIELLGGMLHSADFDHSSFTELVPQTHLPDSKAAIAEQLRKQSWKVASAHAWLARASGALREETLAAAREVLSHLGERRLRQFN